ncbi:MAG: glycyl-radical enzyme activating protein [Lachnospiraceae bacterium]|nr:glycyl-radical enzyme activating protein [Lachnospiraceae bacterium]MDD2957796.1 glycyl-radical enzyme activating protein [Lachnospiraceae bacterium]
MTGRLFNVQRFSVHDGPGIRTTLFFKGCNLRCRWCHNPESYKMEPEIQYLREKCIECGECRKVCEHGIRIEQGKRTGLENCVLCQKCVDACMNGALKYAGREYTLEELTGLALRDRAYYENSGGGITASGGEPLLQSEFVGLLFQKMKEQGISTALDTAGNVEFEHFRRVLPFTDLVLLDIKIMDDELHRSYTGASNRKILENARRLMEMGQRMHIRVPVIAGVNDTLENAWALQKLIDGYECVEKVRFLPYHNMGLAKAASVNLEMEEFAPPQKERLEQIRSVFDFCAD